MMHTGDDGSWMRYLLSLCLLAGSLAAVRQWDGEDAENTAVAKLKLAATVQVSPRVANVANSGHEQWQCGTLLLDARARLPQKYAPRRGELNVSRFLETPAIANDLLLPPAAAVDQAQLPSCPQSFQTLVAPQLAAGDLSKRGTPLVMSERPLTNPLSCVLAGRTTGGDDLCVTFSDEDPLDVRCRYGKVQFSLKLARVATTSWSWHQVAVQVAYQPRQVGRTVLLLRGEVQVEHNAPVGTAGELQTAVESILPHELGLPGLGETIATERWAREDLRGWLQSDGRINAPIADEQPTLNQPWRIVQRPLRTR